MARAGFGPLKAVSGMTVVLGLRARFKGSDCSKRPVARDRSSSHAESKYLTTEGWMTRKGP